MYPERVLKSLQRAKTSLHIGDIVAANKELEKAVSKFPKGFDCWLLFGQAKGRMGDHGGAERCFRKAVNLQPRSADAWFNLGIALSTRALHADAADAYRKALACSDRPYPEIYRNLATCYMELGDYVQAVALCEALVVVQSNGDAWTMLGIACQGAVRYEQALDAYLNALAKGANNYTVHLNIGTCYSVLNDYENAARHAERALAFHPNDAVALHNMGSALFNLGLISEAIEAFGKSTLPAASASLLLALNYIDPPCPARLRREHEAAMAKATSGIASRILPKHRRPGERLRIGLVSPDFREHAVAHFIEGMLSEVDRSRFELFYYSDVPASETDALTQRFQSMSEHWRDMAGADDDALDLRVREDGIHILIDLAGHTHTRLRAFARRMAPVQATYLGYSATTGLAQMDYLLADDVLVRNELDEAHYSEQVIRLGPVLATYTPPSMDTAVSPLPMLANGYPTFGSFAQLRKISPTTVRLWTAVLNAVPDARIMVMGKGLHMDAARKRYLAPFVAQGIDPSRFILRGSGSLDAYLRTYAEVDLILDSTPWNGHTTTVHALWMGVPTLAVRGVHHTSRFGEMVLKAMDLDEFVAHDLPDFAARAKAVTGNPRHLADLRMQLRTRLLASPLCDHQAMARRFEQACVTMWADGQNCEAHASDGMAQNAE